mmetsp:Transcript_129944/g.315676  ORF Transcript_129944/g.315676 Transcript_129944/m.315676 type:complete len:236 (-) Transcript_129944:40-747(-)
MVENVRTPTRATTKLRKPPPKASMSSCFWEVCKFNVCLLSCEYRSTISFTGAGGAEGTAVSPKYRRRARLPSPHFAVQSPQVAQSPHAQYCFSWHCRGQALASSASKGSQVLPPCWGYWVTWRKRVRSPSHLAQAPQSCHSPYAQSMGAGPGHLPEPHCSTSVSGPSQALPPLAGALRTSRLRECWPPPQVALQVSHADHSPSSQSTGGSSVHAAGVACSGDGLQGEVSFRWPLQ